MIAFCAERLAKFFWLPFAIAAECSGATPEVPINGPVESPCPDLSGTYREEGTMIDRHGTRLAAHLSWLAWGAKEKSAKHPLNDSLAPGAPLTYFAKVVRLSHPTAGEFMLEAFDGDMASLGTFNFGPAGGWKCGDDAFFAFSNRTGGGEGVMSDSVDLGKLYRTSEGALVHSIEIWRRPRAPIFLMFVPTGPWEKIIDTKRRFERIK